MEAIAKKLRQQELLMADEKGPFDLFALFLREDAPGKWDLIVAAEWIEKNKEASFKYVAGIVQKALSKEELLKLSRIVIIAKGNPALAAYNKMVGIKHGLVEVTDSNLFGLQIKHAYVITSQRRLPHAPDSDK